jgi:hypothetical protein
MLPTTRRRRCLAALTLDPRHRHECTSCGRLLAVQQGSVLHIKYKELRTVVQGSARIHCRCGSVTVVVTDARGAA